MNEMQLTEVYTIQRPTKTYVKLSMNEQYSLISIKDSLQQQE